jgi:hypothetical protein
LNPYGVRAGRGCDQLAIDLHKPDNLPPAILIRWPDKPAICTPAQFDQVAANAMRLLSSAAVELAAIRVPQEVANGPRTAQMSDKIPRQPRKEIPTMTQSKPKATMLKWIIFGALLGGFAGTVLMFSAQKYREAVWGYTGLALLILGVLIAVTGLFIIAANAIRFPQDNGSQQQVELVRH